jgi:site-specific DNA-methyltransferase (adenine-specific)
MIEKNKIYVGNNLDILKTFTDNSIDSIVTDPPYGLGKEPNAVEVLQSWVTSGYHEVKGKGFMGKEWDAFVPQPILWKECLRVLKPGGYLLSFSGTRTYDWIVMGLRLAGFEIRDMIAWLYGSGFPKSQNISIFIDKSKKLQGHRGKATSSFLVGNKRHDNGKELEGSKTMEAYEPKSDEAKQWQGWGTALKPALEPIVMARKPLDGTVANNVLKNGVGGINIDECRVGTEDLFLSPATPNKGTFNASFNNDYKGKIVTGRFPANVIHDGSDEVVSLFPNTNGGTGETKVYESYDNDIHFNASKVVNRVSYAGEGSAARFFYTAKASQTERNWGLGDFADDKGGSYEFRIDGSLDGKIPTRKNIHPTVKPIDLMRYLVRLVTPKGGICLDPFMGSGTTAVACKAEKLDYIGCELMPEYAKIAEARIKAETVFYDIYDFLGETNE